MIPTADKVAKDLESLETMTIKNTQENRTMVMALVLIARAILVASQTLAVAIVKKAL